MSSEILKAMPVDLRSLGKDERWLQDQISADPSILGLGELVIVGREYRQPNGGRIDFLMVNRDEDQTYYEVEVMLGGLDEKHIIHIIEYWDKERQHRPTAEHRAVSIAEHITSRFFNVLRLLNRAVPLIAIKLSAFKVDDKIVLHPVTVLDVVEESIEPDDVDQAERADRQYWEKQGVPAFLSIVDKIIGTLTKYGYEPRLTYTRRYIALGTSGNNFCWLSPRKIKDHCRIGLRVGSEERENILNNLSEKGIDASARGTSEIRFNCTTQTFDSQFNAIAALILQAEDYSRT
ncbi:MAG TPA: hypothetical protein VFT64_04320 [Rickettsiales bacterium]|nr:hypothetical protein [Rickettsiales bacterium]